MRSLFETKFKYAFFYSIEFVYCIYLSNVLPRRIFVAIIFEIMMIFDGICCTISVFVLSLFLVCACACSVNVVSPLILAIVLLFTNFVKSI